MKFRKLFYICLLALLILTTGCSASNGDNAVNSGTGSASGIQSSEPSSFISSETSSVQSAVSEQASSKPVSSKKSILKNTSSAPKVISKKKQSGSEWSAYIDEDNNLRIKKRDGSNDKVIVKDVAEAPCVAGEWVYYLPNLDEIDKVKLDGSQKTKVCGTDAFKVYNANLNISHEINGSTSVTAEYKNGYILYKCFQLKEGGDKKSNPPSYYKLDLNTNKITSVKNS